MSWNYLGTVGRIAATFVSQIALARLLGPEQVGMFGYALLTVSLLALVVEMGLQMALVQVPILDEEVVAVACGRLLLAGFIAAVGVYLLADHIAAVFFATPQAAPVLRAMAPTLVVGAISAAATAMLSRDIEFKVIQLAGLASYCVGYLVVGVVAALWGLGVWSLVLAWHVQTLVACVAMLHFGPRSLMPGNPFGKLRIAKFGAAVMVTNMVNWVIDNGPHVAIGRWLGPSLLGQYTIANNLVKVPADHLVRNLQTVLFPLASRAENDQVGVRRAYLTALAGVGLVSFPTFVFVALMPYQIVLLLLGAKWVVAADVLAPLSLAMIGHAMEALCGPILTGRGEPSVELRVKVVTLAVMLPVLVLTTSWSLAAVGWGVAMVYFFRWMWMNAAVMRRLHISIGDISRALLGPCLLAGICWIVAIGVGTSFSAHATSVSPVWLLLTTAGCSVLWLAIAALLMPHMVLGPHLLALLDRVIKQRPALARIPGLQRVVVSAARSSS